MQIYLSDTVTLYHIVGPQQLLEYLKEADH